MGRHASPQVVVVNPSDHADVAGLAQTPGSNARAELPVKDNTQASIKTSAVVGSVMNEQGSPISGAKVWGGSWQNPFATDTTDSSGRFALDKVSEPGFVTVMADGFAADQQRVDPTNSPGGMVFRLGLSRPLNIRVVDETGQGVAGVKPFLAEWWGEAGTLGQYLPQQTDAEGRLRWRSAPKGGLTMEFGKEGYRHSRTNKFKADGEEHSILLHPTATASGIVTDAGSGIPMPSFNFTLGYSQLWLPPEQKQMWAKPMWDWHGHASSNGFYKVVIEENQTPYLRIEADGYETVETEIQLTEGFESVQDFQLKRKTAANSIRGTVFLPDGSPASSVEVALCTAEAGVMLKGTAFAPGAFGNISGSKSQIYRRTTDEQGSFSFDAMPGAHAVVAVGPAGLGQARCFDFSKPLEIRLRPWSRIEGTVRTRDGQWAERKVKWRHTGNLTSWMTLFYDPEGFSTLTDSAGAFTLALVPPGDGRVGLDDGQGAPQIVSASIRVNPGETARAQIGGVGASVTGKLVAPPGIEIRSWSNQVTVAHLHVEWNPYRLPKDLNRNAAERWKLEFEDTEAGRIWFRDQNSYDFKVGADGSFNVPEVLPGKYRLFVSVVQGNLGSGSDSALGNPWGAPQIAFGGMILTVPDESGASTPSVDLGDIILHPTP
jgi:hypothetical protein